MISDKCLPQTKICLEYSSFICGLLFLKQRVNNIKVTNKSRLTGALAGSLKALKQNPVIFLPKLVSTFLGAIWFVAILDTAKSGQVSLSILPIFLVSIIALLFIGLFASVLVSAMVDLRDRNSGLRLLKRATVSSREKLFDIAVATAFIFGITIVTYLIFVLGFLAYLLTQSTFVLALAVILSFGAVFLISFFLYFIPVSIFEKNSFSEALKDSSGFSSDNSKDVTLLMAFSFLLLVPAFLFTGKLETLGYAGFVVSRMVSGLVNTYVFTVSPEYYLSSKSLD